MLSAQPVSGFLHMNNFSFNAICVNETQATFHLKMLSELNFLDRQDQSGYSRVSIQFSNYAFYYTIWDIRDEHDVAITDMSHIS